MLCLSECHAVSVICLCKANNTWLSVQNTGRTEDINIMHSCSVAQWCLVSLVFAQWCLVKPNML